MLTEFQHIDAVFKWIKTITLLVVTVYMVWCYCIIRKMRQPSGDNRAGYSVNASQRTIAPETVIALQPVR